MECIVCRQKIKPGEQIFWGNQMECCGLGESDCSYSVASEGLMGAVHLSCLESPAEAVRTPNTEVAEAVVRSDALGMFDGVL